MHAARSDICCAENHLVRQFSLNAQVPLHYIGRRRFVLVSLDLAGADKVRPERLERVGKGDLAEHNSALEERRLIGEGIAEGFRIGLGKEYSESRANADRCIARRIPGQSKPGSEVEAGRVDKEGVTDGRGFVVQDVPEIGDFSVYFNRYRDCFVSEAIREGETTAHFPLVFTIRGKDPLPNAPVHVAFRLLRKKEERLCFEKRGVRGEDISAVGRVARERVELNSPPGDSGPD